VSSSTFLSVEDYLRRTEKPNCEYLDGVLQPKAMPATLHAWIQSILIQLLSRQGKLSLAELTLRVGPTAFLVPDVAVVRSLQFPYPTDPAELCVEILSPEDRLGAMLAKCERYHAWGVPFCWVIDPVKRVAWDYPLGGEPTRVDQTGSLQTGAVIVGLKELFDQLKD
jgi:Uma2 family endonuclease